MEEKAKTIKDVLANDRYFIPRYQRNYAWGKAEISQLIKDIDEFFPEDNNEKKSYYLGSLVCFKREDGSFELIDGQQRHTTLTLINLVLKNWIDEHIAHTVSTPNLKFDSRKKSQRYIESLYRVEKANFQKQVEALNISGTGSFKDAIELIQEEFRIIKSIQRFADHFYNNVFLFRVEVPEDTDLNHYFEIMNNRGEQLEKHEIVKANLMGKISNLEEQETFATIWDACSDMTNYVYFNFDKEKRKALFTEEGELCVEGFAKNMVNKTKGGGIGSVDENKNEGKDSMLDILTNHHIPHDFPKEEKFIPDKYRSIIDFPNFLLQVLKVRYDKVSLDDKNLLSQFEEFKPNPKVFIFDLLKYRVLFDKYVIKQDLADEKERNQNWELRKLNADFEVPPIKTFNQPKENDDELVMLQTMLYYSDSTNTYNNWLQEVLKFEHHSSLDRYTKKVREIAKSYFDSDKMSYPEITVFNLYYVDFLLWKIYTENIKGKDSFLADNSDPLNNLKKKIFNQKGRFVNFKFRQLNSKEHLAAQSNPSSESIFHEELNGIGNLCLISTSQNSAGNKENPNDKKKRFYNDNLSLKRLIMFESYEDNKWEQAEIIKHRKEIEQLINLL